MNPTMPLSLPHDIHGALPIGWPWWAFVALGIGFVALVCLAFALRAWWLRRRRPPLKAPVDMWETLLARVRGAKAPAAFDVGRVQEDYFFALSLLLREAIELRTKMPATDLTFQELKEPLRLKLPLSTADVEAVLAFLERADMVKFAGAPSDLTEAEAAQTRVEGWVRSLRPRAVDAGAPDRARRTSEGRA